MTDITLCTDCGYPICNTITTWIGYPTVKTCDECSRKVISAKSVNERLTELSKHKGGE